MLAAQTTLQNAQKVKEFLIRKDIINHNYICVKEMGLMYFPITQKINVPHAKVLNTKFTFPQKPRPPTPQDLLKNDLTKKELKLLPQAQELVGTIMILEVPEELIKKEHLIAKAYLQTNRQITTIVKKEDIHAGEYRLRTVKVLAGINTKETTHHENNISLKLDLEKTYFSARTASERLRIAKQVKPQETILVMFAGVAPMPLVIAKNAEPKIIHAVELNPSAYDYAQENIQMNHFEKVISFHHGDVKDIVPKLKMKFDRIAMPLPKTGEEFLPLALKFIKKDGIIHHYAFLEKDQFTAHAAKVKTICTKAGHSIRILRKVKCGQFSPKTFRVCFDIKVIK